MKLNIFKRNRTVSKEPEYINNHLTNGGLLFGTIGTQKSALCLSAVFSAIEIITNSIAELPILIKSGKEIVTNHSLNTVFKSGVQSKFILMKQLITDMLLHGNGYAYIERSNDGTVTGIRYLEHGDVSVHWNKAKKELYYHIPTVRKGKIEPIDVIHLYKNSYDGITGKGILSYANRTIDLANYTEDAAQNYFSSGCNLSGILSVQGVLSDKQKQEIRDNWSQTHSGNGSSGLAVLSGNMNYQSIGTNSKDSQLLESRTFNISEVARYFNISPVLLSDLTHSSYSTIEASQMEFIIHTLLPYISLIESEFNRKLLKPSESDLTIDLDETFVLKADKQATANYLGTLTDKGILSINEARYLLGYGEVEGGDKHRIAYSKTEDNDINTQKNTDEGNTQ